MQNVNGITFKFEYLLSHTCDALMLLFGQKVKRSRSQGHSRLKHKIAFNSSMKSSTSSNSVGIFPVIRISGSVISGSVIFT